MTYVCTAEHTPREGSRPSHIALNMFTQLDDAIECATNATSYDSTYWCVRVHHHTNGGVSLHGVAVSGHYVQMPTHAAKAST